MCKLPAQAKPGHVYHFESFVFTNGERKNKYLLMLACYRSDDYIFRLLTSRQHGRPTDPPCHCGNPYPSFYLHTAGGILPKASWLDLRKQDDYDGQSFDSRLSAGQISLVGPIGQPLFRAALECVAQADDTTFAQEQALRDLLSTLPGKP
jgi:hypothetical protein